MATFVYPCSGETARLLNRLTEILSMFNPSVSSFLTDHTSSGSGPSRSLLNQAEDLVLSLRNKVTEEQWKLLLLFVPVDDICVCDGKVKEAMDSTVQEVEEVLDILQRTLDHTLIHVVVWGGETETNLLHESACQCEAAYTENRHKLERGMLTFAMQDFLGGLLESRIWFSERMDFSVALQSTPAYIDPEEKSSSPIMDKLALQLWSNLLQPMSKQPDTLGNNIIACPSEERPYLRTHQNSKSQTDIREKQHEPTPLFNPVMGTEFMCPVGNPSPTPPTSVHALRPEDIKVVAALGDSLTAANGVGAHQSNLLGVLTEYRGLSWSIGGDQGLANVTTLANILREFNPLLTGFSTGTGSETSPKAFLNQAVPGAQSRDMASQARTLIQKMKTDPRIDFENDWKVITLFIGGNDLCAYCFDTLFYHPDNVAFRIRDALDILHKEVPRALVNLVEVLHITPLRALHEDSSNGCPTWLVNILCPCVLKAKAGSQELQKLIDYNRGYQKAMRDLVDTGRYDTHSNFTVVLQPFFRDVVLPVLENGKPDRSYFSPDCFHLSQKAHTLMARALWNNMLEPLGNKTATQDFAYGVNLHCPSETRPFLATYDNSNYTYPGIPSPPPPITNWGSDFSCVDTAPSPSVPTSVHKLRPGDIKVVGSLGDSLTAAFGAKAENLFELQNEERGVSWSIGGDETLETVTTLPNILKKFNSKIFGFSTGPGTRPNGFNMAISGAKASGIPQQTRDLVAAMQNSIMVNFEEDWKLVTLFIGGNDLCQYCLDRASLSPYNYTKYLEESLDILYREVPRVLVNVVEILEIEGLRKIKRDTLGCSFLQEILCPCFLEPPENSPELSEMKRINRELQIETKELVYGGRYDGREDFAAVIQPFFRSSVVPMGMDGQPDVSYFSVDCFHFAERGHAQMAIALWNNMLEPVDDKQSFNNFTYDRSKIKCPTMDHPYIFTSVNSQLSQPSQPSPTTPTTPTTTPVPGTPLPNNCRQDSVPAWGAAVLAVGSLLIGWGVTWLLFSYRDRRNRKRAASRREVGVKGTEL
ncbi:phospholipase B1, membrane-associated [Chanos chanos]|uniref:Phospholipase B1, membrane-associated n=1 Tax=Chanos chanos TaxID=29144 RepID=A0A6J2WG47_CHACN|nr:phospholipase B1, membrane-associated [Chanos chanos]